MNGTLELHFNGEDVVVDQDVDLSYYLRRLADDKPIAICKQGHSVAWWEASRAEFRRNSNRASLFMELRPQNKGVS